MIVTARLRLRAWEERHRADFAALHADPEVMADLGGPIGAAESGHKFDRYYAAQQERGFSRWAVEDPGGEFLGYAGIMPRPADDHPLGAHVEVGWRLVRAAWGHGYATEGASAALAHARGAMGLAGIVAYTGADNLRSQAVMRRLGLVREPRLDFVVPARDGGRWQGLVWAVPDA